ncbi:MAG: anti-sigma factor antagonist [Ignavibacteriales bacterium]|nr:anti-sigma factor antagonist [Ignavibacteriales bacterium]
MKTKMEERYGAVVLSLSGNVMGGPDVAEFSDLLHKLLDEGKKNVVVDLAGVKFMNSSGLGMLISGMTTMTKGEGTFALANVGEKIQSLLMITKLITIFKTYDSVDDATEALKN